MNYSRRKLMSALGTAVTTAALAGCSGDGDGGDGDGETPTSDGNGSDEDGDTSGSDSDGNDGDSGTDTDDGDGGDGDSDTPTPGAETPEPPASDANPEDLLPEPPDGWEQGELVEQTVEGTAAEAGFGAFYTDPDGSEYYVEILRWPSESDAESGWQGLYDSGNSRWLVYVSLGNFSFAGNGPDNSKVGGDAVTLLGNSPGLTEEYIEQNNRVE